MSAQTERWVQLAPDCSPIPERLLLAQAQGRVLFIAGAGVSLPADRPDFKQLVLDLYQRLDVSTYPALLDGASADTVRALPPNHQAEVVRFRRGDYDVVLGMLERRLEGELTNRSIVRDAVAERLARGEPSPADIHRALVCLSDRGGSTSIVTTNFDCLLEAAAGRRGRLQTYALGGIPRPSRRPEFAGVFHIHGALPQGASRISDLILTDHDFGEFYLRRRTVPDFIYDAARLFHLVLVGYSANDPPMRYLLNAVAADGTRFSDLKERFSFFGGPTIPDQVALEDWKGRGITPIAYDEADRHDQLRRTLNRWAELCSTSGFRQLDKTIRRIVRKPRQQASQHEQDLFDHFVRRGDQHERLRIAGLVSAAGADLEWLDALTVVMREASARR